MAVLNITKVSGVIAFTYDSNQPKYYFGSKGKFDVSNDNVTINVQINDDSYQISLTDLRVNNQIPANITVAKVLLNAIFGT